MEYIVQNDKVILKNVKDFNIKEILECGQCFRFNKIDDMHYKIIAYGKVLYIKQDTDVTLYPTTEDDFLNIWNNYFDLDTDYSKIKNELSKDKILKDAIEYARGIRILNQEPFECLISFIISQNNRIPMIKKVIQNISEKYGEKVQDEYLFPTIEMLERATNEELRECKTGFRDKYILDAIKNIKEGLDLIKLYDIPFDKAKIELLKIKGVGTKVADCVLLFSLKKNEVFPTDVWIKRVMEYFYFDHKEIHINEIHKYAKDNWGDLSGYAQQYLFYFARNEQIGK